jgi:hypothetical protein
MPTDSATWRNIREDFEKLPPADWILFWSSRPPVAMFIPFQLQSQWTWFRPTDPSLRARASAIFLKAAKARGYDNEDQWLDELRHADFVQFQLTGKEPDQLPDGTLQESESGDLHDAVKHSITLCHKLEAGDAPKPLIGRLSREAIARMEAATAAFMADYWPKLQREVEKLEHEPDRRIRHAELLRELVIHRFETAARECMTLFASVAEFETELRGDIARFVQFRVCQYQWLGDAMRSEINAGFTFFVRRANPWAGIPETDRASKWHVGAITEEALSHMSMKLIADATARAASGGFREPDQADTAEPDGGDSTKERAQVDRFIESVLTGTGTRITRTDIWRVAGYTEATQFERFQRGKGASAGSIAKFSAILKLTPAEFLERLRRLTAIR